MVKVFSQFCNLDKLVFEIDNAIKVFYEEQQKNI